jgi:type III restriction enzyme
MKPNPAISEAVWEKLLSLPSQSLPKRQARPVKRLTALAHELAADGLLADAGKIVHRVMHKALDAAQVRYADAIKKAREAVLTVEGKTVKTNIETQAMTFNDFIETADYIVIDDAYKRAGRVITADLARTYSEHLAGNMTEGEDLEDALIEAHTVVAAIGLVADIKGYLESEAEKLSNQWLTEYRVAIKKLSDERQDIYREIREMSAVPIDVDLARPKSWLQPSSIRETDGSDVALPRFEKHLLCDEEGLFPEYFTSSWEPNILRTELHRSDNVAWYRNPDRPSQDSLGIIYQDDNELKIVRPDFLFFASSDDGKIAVDIVDPHGHHLADSLPKLQGLAQYAEAHGGYYRRIEAVAVLNDEYKLLDLKQEEVRAAVFAAKSAKSLYGSSVAQNYRIDL